MNTHSRVQRFTPPAVAAGILAVVLFMASACSKGNPLAPETADATAGAQSAAPARTVEAHPTEEAAAEITFGQGEAAPEGFASAARQYGSPIPGNCIQAFYDSTFYNWLAFRNLCNQAILIDYVWVNPGYGGGAVTLRPGQKSSTGYSRSEISAKRGYQIFSCAAGYIPVDANNNYVTRINTRFRCLKL